MDEYLHDFDVFHVEQVAELLHYMDGKYLSAELGGKYMHICMIICEYIAQSTTKSYPK